MISNPGSTALIFIKSLSNSYSTNADRALATCHMPRATEDNKGGGATGQPARSFHGRQGEHRSRGTDGALGGVGPAREDSGREETKGRAGCFMGGLVFEPG